MAAPPLIFDATEKPVEALEIPVLLDAAWYD
jgi:hypothetical protein